MFEKLLNKTSSTSEKDTTYASNSVEKSSEPTPMMPLADHTYCPTDNYVSKEGINCIQSVKHLVNETLYTPKDLQNNDRKLKDKTNENVVATFDGTNEDLNTKVIINVDGKSDPAKNVFEGNCTLKESNLNKHHYKIGITLVKKKNCNEGSDLDFCSLKSILTAKVNELFNSLCDDETISRSLVKCNTTTDGDNSNSVEEPVVGNEDSISDVNVGNSNVQIIESNELDSVESKNVKKTKKRIRKIGENGVKCRRRSEMILDEHGSYLCSTCGALMKDRRQFLAHRRLYHMEKVCQYCNATLPSLQEYKCHLRVSHVDKISTNCCELCGATFIRRERLERHKLILHNIGEYFYCNICNKKCASKQQLHCHKNDAHNKLKNQCNACNMSFVSHQSYLSHLRKKHGVDTWKRETFTCPNCGKSFNRRTDINLHSAKCNPEANAKPKMSAAALSASSELYSCLICSVKIRNLDVLKQHMNYHANDENIKDLVGREESSEFQCSVCNCYFRLEKELALHRFFSHQEPPYLCNATSDCKMTFWKRMSMVMHQMSVHKIRNNVCKICSENLSDFRAKRRHMKKCHPNEMTKDKPYACAVCDRRFFWESTLKTHMVTHSDDKIHKCHLCDKAFKLKFTLSKHLQYHQRKLQMESSEEKHELVKATEFLDVVRNNEFIEVTTSKHSFDISGEVGESNADTSPNLLKMFTVFKCHECNILFTEKEVRDAHYFEAHVSKEDLTFKIEVLNENTENVTELLS